ncbi:MAG: hypothetical protein B7Z12_05905 [Caulobacter vibrioides]|uniref:Uncharacterized protein n=1 Tax=Caulobacter vibrioides TaxID=155892 RepID=A0A258D9I3_CAUVI|nr:MAG: hypothetical protein B7Z12_05905 [Caulobacter vibrioides]
MIVSMGASVERRRRATIFAGSLLLHVALLAWLALPAAPLLQTFAEDDLPTMTLELQRPAPLPREAPRPRPSSATEAASARPLPFKVRAAVRPVPAGTPTVEVPTSGLARPGVAIRPAPLPGEGAGDLRTALRGSATGCVSADAVGLNRRERERCDERFGAAKAKGDPLSAMNADKRRALDAQAAAQDAYRRYQNAPMGPGVDHRSRDHPGTMKEIPFVLGAQQDGLGRERKSVVDEIRRNQDLEKRATRFLELQKKAGQRP